VSADHPHFFLSTQYFFPTSVFPHLGCLRHRCPAAPSDRPAPNERVKRPSAPCSRPLYLAAALVKPLLRRDLSEPGPGPVCRALDPTLWFRLDSALANGQDQAGRPATGRRPSIGRRRAEAVQLPGRGVGTGQASQNRYKTRSARGAGTVPSRILAIAAGQSFVVPYGLLGPLKSALLSCDSVLVRRDRSFRVMAKDHLIMSCVRRVIVETFGLSSRSDFSARSIIWVLGPVSSQDDHGSMAPPIRWSAGRICFLPWHIANTTTGPDIHVLCSCCSCIS
jgi:hypothetical protein